MNMSMKALAMAALAALSLKAGAFDGVWSGPASNASWNASANWSAPGGEPASALEDVALPGWTLVAPGLKKGHSLALVRLGNALCARVVKPGHLFIVR